MDKVYHSKYLADTAITEAQYLTEIICERIAKRDKLSLGVKFWDSPKWRKMFVRQIVAANKLLKEYPIGLILKALAHKKGQWITSLGAKKQIEELIDKYFSYTVYQGENVDPDVYSEKDQNAFDIDTLREGKQEKATKSLWEKLNG